MTAPQALACPLCGHPNPPVLIEGYFHCPTCDLRFLDPARRLDPIAEKARYELHDNSFDDPGYRDFLRPLAEAISVHVPKPAQGLDYGAGPAPVLADILNQSGYSTEVYDPFFAQRDDLLKQSYQFVCASEVVEHFHNPAFEFLRLRGLLKPGGVLALMTALYDEKIDFSSWYYRKDPTHVVFYSSITFVWISKRFLFTQPEFRGHRIVVLRDSSN